MMKIHQFSSTETEFFWVKNKGAGPTIDVGSIELNDGIYHIATWNQRYLECKTYQAALARLIDSILEAQNEGYL